MLYFLFAPDLLQLQLYLDFSFLYKECNTKYCIGERLKDPNPPPSH